MENTRLLKLLRTLDKQERSEMKKVVKSPFFNHRSDVAALYQLLEKSIALDRKIPSKEVLFQLIYTDSELFDDHKMRLLISLLFQICTEYLSVRSLKQDKVAQQMRIAEQFRKRNLPGHFASIWKSLDINHENQALRNATYFHRKYQFSLEKYRLAFDEQNLNPDYLQGLTNQLDTAFLIQKLAHSCFLISHETVSNVTYDFALLDKIIDFIEQDDVLGIPAIAVYYNCYKALTHPGEPHYFQTFRELSRAHDAKFSREELRDLYVLAINFCIRQYNLGNTDYLEDQFNFYKDGLEKGYFLVAGWLSRYTYQNAVTIGLVMEQYEWVEEFVHRYQEQLQGPYRESVYCFNMARLKYQRKNFDEALQLLQRAEYKDVILNLAAKTLQLKIFYENDEYDLLHSHLQAFKVFIRRKKVLGYHRENYLNTIRLTRKLLEINPFDKSEKEALRLEVENTKGVGDKNWLLSQLQ